MEAVVAHQFADLDAVHVERVAEPVLGEHDVLIAVEAVPVNYVDLVVLRGDYQFKAQLPFIPGKGPTGVVQAVGPAVERLRAGERVIALVEEGGYAGLVRAREGAVHRIPDELSFEAAAAMSLAYETAWLALRERARLTAGESVLVLGAGGAVGQAAVQLARAMGASLILGGTSRPGRVSEDVDHVVDLTEGDLRESVRAQVLALTEGRGVDVVIDPLGGDAFSGAVRALAWRGRLVVVGFATGAIPTVKLNYLLVKNIEISGLQISDYRRRMPALVGRCLDEVFGLATTGGVTPPAVTVFPLKEWRVAIEQIATRTAAGRLILCPAAASETRPA